MSLSSSLLSRQVHVAVVGIIYSGLPGGSRLYSSAWDQPACGHPIGLSFPRDCTPPGVFCLVSGLFCHHPSSGFDLDNLVFISNEEGKAKVFINCKQFPVYEVHRIVLFLHIAPIILLNTFCLNMPISSVVNLLISRSHCRLLQLYSLGFLITNLLCGLLVNSSRFYFRQNMLCSLPLIFAVKG